MIARKMASKLDSSEWKVILVDKDTRHYYQPGFLFIPFGKYEEKDVIKPNAAIRSRKYRIYHFQY